MQADVDALKAALAGDDDDAVKTAFDKLNQSQGKLGEAIYASSQASQAASGRPTPDGGAGTGSEAASAVLRRGRHRRRGRRRRGQRRSSHGRQELRPFEAQAPETVTTRFDRTRRGRTRRGRARTHPAPTRSRRIDEELTVDDILSAPQNTDAAAEDAVLADLESALLIDLKRLQAEYANYRRRTEDAARARDRARQGRGRQGPAPGARRPRPGREARRPRRGNAFAAIGDKVRAVAEKLGVISYGAAGEAFDPQQHEAIFQHRPRV